MGSKLMVCEPLRGVVAHATFQRQNPAHLAILHGGVTLANSLSSSTVPPLAFLRSGARVSSTEPRPHQDCDKPDKPCRRHRRETPVYRIKIMRIHSANTVPHLSSPETRRCFTPTM